MSNEFYNASGTPATSATGASSPVRAEFTAVAAGFAMLPTLAANANKAVVVNAGATGLTVTTGSLALAGNLATTGAFNTTFAQTATVTLTLPAVSGTLATALIDAFTTGDVKLTIKTVADTGWVLMNDTTIGDASSGASGRANADTSALFTLLYNNTVDADCAVSTGRGASAAADYAAHKTIALPKALGRALATYGTGSGLTARTMAAKVGVETHPLVTGELASHTHTGTTAGASATHTHSGSTNEAAALTTGGAGWGSGAPANATGVLTFTTGVNSVDHTHTITTASTGSGTAHQNMQPTLFLNTMIKL